MLEPSHQRQILGLHLSKATSAGRPTSSVRVAGRLAETARIVLSETGRLAVHESHAGGADEEKTDRELGPLIWPNGIQVVRLPALIFVSIHEPIHEIIVVRYGE